MTSRVKTIASITALALLMAGTAQADNCQTNISVTRYGQAAMRAYTMSIEQNNRLVTSTVGHSWSVPLDCGTGYLLRVESAGINRTLRFAASGTTTISIEMGD